MRTLKPFTDHHLVCLQQYNVTESKESEVGVAPIIDVSPSSLSFVDAEVGAPEEDLFTITNVGSSDLNVSNVELVGSEAFSFTQLGNPILTPDKVLTFT